MVDLAGPVILDPSTPPTPESPTDQKKSEVDLLKVLVNLYLFSINMFKYDPSQSITIDKYSWNIKHSKFT